MKQRNLGIIMVVAFVCCTALFTPYGAALITMAVGIVFALYWTKLLFSDSGNTFRKETANIISSIGCGISASFVLMEIIVPSFYQLEIIGFFLGTFSVCLIMIIRENQSSP